MLAQCAARLVGRPMARRRMTTTMMNFCGTGGSLILFQILGMGWELNKDFEERFLYKIRHAGPVCGAASRPANDRQWLDERWRLRWWRKLFFHLLQDGVQCPITSDPSDRTPSMKGSWFTRPCSGGEAAVGAPAAAGLQCIVCPLFCTRESRLETTMQLHRLLTRIAYQVGRQYRPNFDGLTLRILYSFS